MTSASRSQPPHTSETNVSRGGSQVTAQAPASSVSMQASFSGSVHAQPVMPNRNSISNSIARTLSREKSNASLEQPAPARSSRVTLTREEQLDTFGSNDEEYREELRGELEKLSKDDSLVSVKNSKSDTSKTRRDSL